MAYRISVLLGAAACLVLTASGCAVTGPTSPNESAPNPRSEAPAAPPSARGDNPNLPNPVTPQAANESAPQPQATVRNPTNSSGMGNPAGGTR